MAIAEAMAAGRFAIASAVGGIPDMIENQVNGCLIDIKNPDDLVKILDDLHNNSAKTSIIAGKARETALKNYDSAVVAGETRKFYQKILEKEGSK
jgi:glycosyltransferase involved in cell wall biosynthesis